MSIRLVGFWILSFLVLICCFAIFNTPVFAQTGSTKNEIVIGSIQDLSGPIAGYGKSARNGFLLSVEEQNAKGGVHGRKIRLIVEDSAYDPKKGVLAAQKLVQKDKVFLVIGTIGTVIAMSTMDIFFEHQVPHLFPLSSARQMFDPLHRLKYAASSTYYDQARSGVRALLKVRAERKWCVIYQDDDFGVEVLAGAEYGLRERAISLIEKTSHKRGATDFSSQVARMKAAGCDTIIMGTVYRETASILLEARKLGLIADFYGISAAYTHLIPSLAGSAAENFMAGHTLIHPYEDGASPEISAWIERYKQRFNEPPDLLSAFGQSFMDKVILVLQKTGPDLSVDNFIRTLENTTIPPDIYGGDTMSYTNTKHLGSTRSRLSQVKNGRWIVVSDYVEP